MVYLCRGKCGPYRISSCLSSACLLRKIRQQNQRLHCNQLIVLTEEEVYTIIAITFKVLNNALDAINMQLTLMMHERCRLMYSISNVRSGIARKMHRHTYGQNRIVIRPRTIHPQDLNSWWECHSHYSPKVRWHEEYPYSQTS